MCVCVCCNVRRDMYISGDLIAAVTSYMMALARDPDSNSGLQPTSKSFGRDIVHYINL